ncbi:RING finger containing protein [Cryptosporidium felis]|nr:RING finger containing protein [Cryptosporidium felis]
MSYHVPEAPRFPFNSRLAVLLSDSSEDGKFVAAESCLKCGTEAFRDHEDGGIHFGGAGSASMYSLVPELVDFISGAVPSKNISENQVDCDLGKENRIETGDLKFQSGDCVGFGYEIPQKTVATISQAQNKRPRHFYCFSCNQFKPRSTKARFKVCKHVSCYHCLRKALHVEYWAAKNDIWDKCRAECPFCHVTLDWTKMKPYIVLSLEAKQFPLMSLCNAEERQGEAFQVIHSFFPRGVPYHVIYGNVVDFSIKPKVTQVLFGGYLELLNSLDSYEKFFQMRGENAERNSTEVSDSDVDFDFVSCREAEEEVEDDSDSSSGSVWAGRSYDFYPDLFDSWRRSVLYSN